MTKQGKGFLKRMGLAVLLTLSLWTLWYWPLIYSLVRPTIVKVLPGTMAAQDQAVAHAQTAKDSIFSFDRLGIVAPLTEAPEHSPYDFADWPSISAALEKGVSLTYGGADFAAAPLVYVTGHSSESHPAKYASIFAALGGARIGDTFQLVRQGTARTYTVYAFQAVNPDQVEQYVQNHPATAGKQVAALVTCWVPLTTRQRLVVLAQ